MDRNRVKGGDRRGECIYGGDGIGPASRRVNAQSSAAIACRFNGPSYPSDPKQRHRSASSAGEGTRRPLEARSLSFKPSTTSQARRPSEAGTSSVFGRFRRASSILRGVLFALTMLPSLSLLAGERAKPKEEKRVNLESIAELIKAGERVLNDFAAVDSLTFHQDPPEMKAAINDLLPAKNAFPGAAAAALRAADTQTNLRQAVKDYFEAGTACIDAASHSEPTTRRLCDEMRVKAKSLELELELAAGK
jgi:hypothetical protein